MFNAIGQALLALLEIFKHILIPFNNSNMLLSYLRVGLCIGIAISVIFMVVKLIKGTVWGS